MKSSSTSLLLSLLCTFAVVVVVSAVEVIPNFLSQADVERYCQQAGRNRLPTAVGRGARGGGVARRLHAPVSLEDDLHAKIRSALGDQVSVVPLMDNDKTNNVVVSTLTGTSKKHIEYYQDGSFEPVEEQVGFVFLTEEEGAYFHQGDVKVPVEKGTLVTFEGNVEHQTVIPRGKTLQILGPFTLHNRRLTTTGVIGHLAKKSVKGGNMGMGGLDSSTTVGVISAPVPSPTLDLSSANACGCKFSNGQMLCITTGCGTVSSIVVPARAPTPVPPTTTTTTVVAPAPTPVPPTTTTTTIAAPASAPVPPPTMTTSTVAAPAPAPVPPPTTTTTTIAAPAPVPVPPPTMTTTIVAAPAPVPIPPTTTTTTGVLVTNTASAPVPVTNLDSASSTQWEMRGGTGTCQCTVVTGGGGYCTGVCRRV